MGDFHHSRLLLHGFANSRNILLNANHYQIDFSIFWAFLQNFCLVTMISKVQQWVTVFHTCVLHFWRNKIICFLNLWTERGLWSPLLMCQHSVNNFSKFSRIIREITTHQKFWNNTQLTDISKYPTWFEKALYAKFREFSKPWVYQWLWWKRRKIPWGNLSKNLLWRTNY